MRCPYCESENSKVTDSRPTEENTAIRRRRKCLVCSKRFTTYEKIEEIPLMIIKKDKRRESYNRTKLLNGLLKACEKRPVSVDKLEEIVDDIEKQIYNEAQKEVSSDVIGELVMDKLKEVDDVAYVRFASVYRQFTDLQSYVEELSKLLKERK